MSDSPPITEQLLGAIAHGGVRARIAPIIDLCIRAVADLDSLDEGIYQRMKAAQAHDGEEPPSEQDLGELATSVLAGVRALTAHLTSCDFAADDDADDDDAGVDFDFDFGGEPAAPEEVTLDDFDIDSALDGLAPKQRRTSDERWAALSSELTALSYALSTQLEEFDERFASALGQGRLLQALRELDDSGNALIDGVFALMSTICETYLETFDRDRMLPGHKDTLGKALMVRRGIADLRRAVKQFNPTIQDPSAPEELRQASVNGVAIALCGFIEGEVCAAMRPADRLELQSFLGKIERKTLKQAALPCEGFDKYLDSLLSVNQRDVLIRHDRELLGEIAATLEGVGPIVDISPHGAMDMVRQAFDKANALYGYLDPLDALLAEWTDDFYQVAEPATMVEIGKRLAAIAEAAVK